MIHKHTGRWMWQESASVVFWNWEKYSCHSKLVSAFIAAAKFGLSESVWKLEQSQKAVAVEWVLSVYKAFLHDEKVCLYASQQWVKVAQVSKVEPCNGELRTQKLKSHLMRTQSLNVLPLKPRIGQYIAIHATLTARNFFIAYFYPSGPFLHFFQNFRFLLCWLWLTRGSCVGLQNKIGHPAGCRFPCWAPAEYK